MPDHPADTSGRWESFVSLWSGGPGAKADGPVFRAHWVWLPLLLLGISTFLVRRYDLDLIFQSRIFEAGDESWALGDSAFWMALYRYGTIPALIVTLGCLAGYLVSWSKASLKQWRRVFLFVILAGITGPGIVTNLTLKENWGRPRPREIENFGGHNTFEPILTMDRESDGKSFPCGHATMGYLFMGGFFLFRRYSAGVAFAFLIGGFVGGSLTGVARMLQGAHFFSDVIWAAAVCYFVPLGLYYSLGLHRSLRKQADIFEKTPMWVKAASWTTGLLLFAAVMVATPFREKRNYFLVSDHAKAGPLHLELMLKLGDIDVRGAENFHIKGEAYGHGVPTSKIASIYQERDEETHAGVWYMERISGWVSEANQQLLIEVPTDRTERLGIRNGEARVWIELFEPAGELEIHLIEGEGEIHLTAGEIPYDFVGLDAVEVEGIEGWARPAEGSAKVRVHLYETFEGRLILETPREKSRKVQGLPE